MSRIIPVEDQRLRYGASTSPEQLRQRMLIDDERSEPDKATSSDYDIISSLYRMSDADRWKAMQLIPDADCARIVSLIPLFFTIREMSRAEIAQMLANVDGDDD